MNTDKYTVSAAHRITGRARGTIINHMKSGKLSFEKDDHGNPLISAAELIRVYGKRCNFDKADYKAKSNSEMNNQDTVQIYKLEQALALAEQENRHLRDKIDMHAASNDRLNELLDEANKQIASAQTLLTDERRRRADLEETLVRPKSGFLARLFGAG